MSLCLYHECLPITRSIVHTMSPEIQQKNFNTNYREFFNRNTIFKKTEIQITVIQKYKLQNYQNTNCKGTEIQITELQITETTNTEIPKYRLHN